MNLRKGDSPEERSMRAMNKHINRYRASRGVEESTLIGSPEYSPYDQSRSPTTLLSAQLVDSHIKDELRAWKTLNERLEEGEADIVSSIPAYEEMVAQKYRQGNKTFYSLKNIKKRKVLMFDTGISKAINAIWEFCKLADQRHFKMNLLGIGKSTYFQLNVRVFKALVEDYSSQLAQENAEQDWKTDKKDRADEDRMTSKDFYESIFTLVDTWTDKIDPFEYQAFAEVLFEHITVLSPVGGQSGTIAREWRPIEQIECLYEDGESRFILDINMARVMARLTGKNVKRLLDAKYVYAESQEQVDKEKQTEKGRLAAIKLLEDFDQKMQQRAEGKKRNLEEDSNRAAPMAHVTETKEDTPTAEEIVEDKPSSLFGSIYNAGAFWHKVKSVVTGGNINAFIDTAKKLATEESKLNTPRAPEQMDHTPESKVARLVKEGVLSQSAASLLAAVEGHLMSAKEVDLSAKQVEVEVDNKLTSSSKADESQRLLNLRQRERARMLKAKQLVADELNCSRGSKGATSDPSTTSRSDS